MGKELEAFRKICRCLSSSYEFTDEYKKNKKLVETALKEIDDENHCIVDIRVFTPVDTDVFEQLKKEHKALEIIKDKKVDVQMLYDRKNLNEYNWCVHEQARALTQEEYDLLREVLL